METDDKGEKEFSCLHGIKEMAHWKINLKKSKHLQINISQKLIFGITKANLKKDVDLNLVGDQAFKAPNFRPDLPILSRPVPSPALLCPAVPQNSSRASTRSPIFTKFSG